MTKQTVPQINDGKLFFIVLPLLVAIYLAVLWALSAPIETTWFTFHPDSKGPRIELETFGFIYDRRFDIVLGPLVAYLVTWLWRNLFDDRAVTGLGATLTFGGVIGTAATLIAFLSAGAPVALVVGGVWTLSAMFVLLIIRWTIKFIIWIDLKTWLYR